MTLCSVVIPSFNRKNLSLRAINSVLEQTLQDFEIIFINDGSSEDYSEIEKLLSSTTSKYIFQNNLGVSAARNVGIRNSIGKFIFFLDSDDLWLKNKLEKQIIYFKSNPGCIILHSRENWYRFDKFVQVPNHLEPAVGDAFARSLKTCCVNLSSIAIRRELFEDIGLFDEKMRICEDYDLWIRILNKFEIHLLNDILVNKYSGTHPQLSQSESAMDRYRLYSLLKLYINNFLYIKNTKTILVECEIINKAKLLYSGAIKRELVNDSKIYQSIIDFFLNQEDIIHINDILVEFESLLNFRARNFIKTEIK
jgi:glycosyltransferase involved in cell wall biosynthesis